LNLSFEGTGCFPSWAKPSVVWLGLAGDTTRLCELQNQIRGACRAFEANPDGKLFVPHLTIGRVKNGAYKTARLFGAALTGEAKKISIGADWKVDEAALMRSELESAGARHTRLAGFGLSSSVR
jgi:2'-5' RNA ligase